MFLFQLTIFSLINKLVFFNLKNKQTNKNIQSECFVYVCYFLLCFLFGFFFLNYFLNGGRCTVIDIGDNWI